VGLDMWEENGFFLDLVISVTSDKNGKPWRRGCSCDCKNTFN